MAFNIEINTYFGQCTCCLQYAYLKSMWNEHERNGDTEIFAEMLLECFGLNTWYTEDHDKDRICEGCITRLRNACRFKNQVLKIQEDFLNKAVGLKKESTTNYEIKSEGIEEENFEYIEYLDEEILDSNHARNRTVKFPVGRPTRRLRANRRDPRDEQDDPRDAHDASLARDKPKWPRKLPLKLRYQTYKQYTAEDLRDCIEAIKSEEMTVKEASACYSIPAKTVQAKIRMGILEDENPIPLTKTRELIEDIQAILTYTNATPFKCRFNQILCAFCSTECEGDELRAHTVQHHPDRVARVEAMLRPYFQNQIQRIDIRELTCSHCALPARRWADMMQHLASQHNVALKQAATNIVPYSLTPNNACTICDETFSGFKVLDMHMNKHFKNYSCCDCGEPFITLPRLKTHEKVHELGRYPCNVCGRVFVRRQYRNQHVSKTHPGHDAMLKCTHCSDTFKTESLRQKHTTESHGDRIKVINCDLCSATFHFNNLYKKHLRRKHSMENVCDVCGRTFESKFLLNEHQLRHSSKKDFYCDICKKSYFSKSSLQSHLKRFNHSLPRS